MSKPFDICKHRDIFNILSNIYEGVFFKVVTPKIFQLFSGKSTTVDRWYVNTEKEKKIVFPNYKPAVDYISSN